MLYHFLFPLSDQWALFNVFKYITFRAAGASVTSFLACLVLGPAVIEWLRRFSAMNETKRLHAEKIHHLFAGKAAVPTMGGVLIVLAVTVANLLWGDLGNRFLLIALAVVLWFGFVGFADDALKLRLKNSRGLPGRVKLAGQLLLGLAIGTFLYQDPHFSKVLTVPFFKGFTFSLGVFFISSPSRLFCRRYHPPQRIL